MPAGQPRKYRSAEALQSAIDKYFVGQDDRERPYTITGLATAIGLDRKALIEYGSTAEYSNTIKAARARVKNSVEERLLQGGQAAGAIFWLKNNDKWQDKQEIEHSGSI